MVLRSDRLIEALFLIIAFRFSGRRYFFAVRIFQPLPFHIMHNLISLGIIRGTVVWFFQHIKSEF